MTIEFFVAFGLNLFCQATRTTYEILKKKGRVDLENKVLFGAIFATMCLLWISWFVMCPIDPWANEVPTGIRWLGSGLVALGWGLAIVALVQLRGLENIGRLVTAGLFSKLRHPMYTGFILWIIGWGLYNGAGVSLIAGLIGIGNILYWRGLEEAALESRYGEVYRKYRESTWF